MTDEELKALVASNAQSIADLRGAIVNLRQSIAESKVLADTNIKAIAETKAIADSNSRAVLAWESRINQVDEDAQETATSIGANVNYRVDLLAEQVQGLILERRADWAEWREQQAQANAESAQLFNNLLADARADRKAHAERFAAAQKAAEEDRKANAERFAAAQKAAEEDRKANAERFAAAQKEAEEDRKRNEAEHRAFRENIQTLLAEIQQVWRRLNAS